jgi:hypothetical protein
VKQSTLLTVTSLLTILFLTIHLTSDFLHDAGELSLQGVLIAALFLTVLLWGTLVLAERRSGHVIMLLGSLFALGMPVLHLKRATGVADALARPDASFFVWILLALGVTGLFSAVLSVRGLVNLQRGRPGSPS